MLCVLLLAQGILRLFRADIHRCGAPTQTCAVAVQPCKVLTPAAPSMACREGAVLQPKTCTAALVPLASAGLAAQPPCCQASPPAQRRAVLHLPGGRTADSHTPLKRVASYPLDAFCKQESRQAARGGRLPVSGPGRVITAQHDTHMICMHGTPLAGAHWRVHTCQWLPERAAGARPGLTLACCTAAAQWQFRLLCMGRFPHMTAGSLGPVGGRCSADRQWL